MVHFHTQNSDIIPVVERSGANSRKMKALAELKRPIIRSVAGGSPGVTRFIVAQLFPRQAPSCSRVKRTQPVPGLSSLALFRYA